MTTATNSQATSETTAAKKKAPLVSRLSDLGRRTDVVWLDPRIISVEQGHNPRDYTLPENRAHLDELKANIKENGVRQPLTVRFEPATPENPSGKVILVDGECRLTSCNELISEGIPIESVPTIQEKSKDPAERLITALTANTGKPLSKWELGTAFKRLRNFGWDDAKIAHKMGYKERFIHEAVELSDAPDSLKQLLSDQAVTPSLVLQELRTKPSDEAVASIRTQVAKAKAEGKTAKRKKESKLPAVSTLVNLISKIIASVEGDDIFDDEYKYAEVPKTLIRQAAKLVGITEESDKAPKKGDKKQKD